MSRFPASPALLRALLCLGLTALLAPLAQAAEDKLSGDAGLMLAPSQSIIREGKNTLAVLPFVAGDYGRAFARVDTFGVKTLKFGYGHLELIGRYRADAYEVDGLTRRDAPVPLGVGSLQVTPIGAFELNVVRDFGDSAGAVGMARYIAKLARGPVSVYPEVGGEYLNRRYANYYYGTREADASTVGRHYATSNALNLFVGSLLRYDLTDKYALQAYWRYTRYDDTITDSPLVSRKGRHNGFVAVTRSF
ncbi:MipA/OmpV family protein [Viridibacterium curvum]|uniref:MipA/OmpV family protein n=1 Tax=Viridibacterium curvum TaxID=1101404 RepID=A0ABP9QNP1_9RHOO